MLAHLNRLTTHWLPQMVAGQPVGASYPVKIGVVRQNMDTVNVHLDALGE